MLYLLKPTVTWKMQNSIHVTIFRNTNCTGLKFSRFHKQLCNTWKYYQVQNAPEVKVYLAVDFVGLIYLKLLELWCDSIQKDCNWCL